MDSNIKNVILIKKCYQKGTLMKEATNISSDMKNLLTLGNSVSWEMSLMICTMDRLRREIKVSIGTEI